MTADRITLSLPAEATSVALAESAARGMLRNTGFSAAGVGRLVAATTEAVAAGIDASRPADSLRVHYDVAPDAILLTVELRRRTRLRRNGGVVTSVAVTADGRVQERYNRPRPVTGAR